MESEESLIQEVCTGRQAAMRRLYDRYAGYAMATGLRYVPNRDDLHDILQEAFIKVFTSIGSFTWRGEGSLRSWIARIVVNECLTALRRQGRVVFTDTIPEMGDDEDPDLERVSDEHLMECIGQLPDGYRIVLNLFVFEGLSHKQIAERLGISPATSASQYFHAKKMLKGLIMKIEL